MCVDVMATVCALLAAAAVRLPKTFHPSVGVSLFWARISVVTVVCWLLLYYNDLYDFRVVHRRADLLAQTMNVGYLLSSIMLFAAGCDKCGDPVKFNVPGLPKACYDSPRQK